MGLGVRQELAQGAAEVVEAAEGQGAQPGAVAGPGVTRPGLGAGWAAHSRCAGMPHSAREPWGGPQRWRVIGVNRRVGGTRPPRPELRTPSMAAGWHYKRTRWLPDRGSHRRARSCRSRSLFASRCFTILITHSDRGLTPVRAHIGTPPRSRDAPPPMAAPRRPGGVRIAR